MIWHVARDALEKKVCLELSYDGYIRVVEVHAVGQTRTGNIVCGLGSLREAATAKESGGNYCGLMRLNL